mmetsp:Transcript_93687/g.291947  ORF Transcript_93687/g.291947 Transcript_93687/m.291947 type:complete len:281 (+) Transcript_93687:57-899(+)
MVLHAMAPGTGGTGIKDDVLRVVRTYCFGRSSSLVTSESSGSAMCLWGWRAPTSSDDFREDIADPVLSCLCAAKADLAGATSREEASLSEPDEECRLRFDSMRFISALPTSRWKVWHQTRSCGEEPDASRAMSVLREIFAGGTGRCSEATEPALASELRAPVPPLSKGTMLSRLELRARTMAMLRPLAGLCRRRLRTLGTKRSTWRSRSQSVAVRPSQSSEESQPSLMAALSLCSFFVSMTRSARKCLQYMKRRHLRSSRMDKSRLASSTIAPRLSSKCG